MSAGLMVTIDYDGRDGHFYSESVLVHAGDTVAIESAQMESLPKKMTLHFKAVEGNLRPSILPSEIVVLSSEKPKPGRHKRV